MIFSKSSKKIGVGLLTWGALGLLLLFSASARAQVTGATLSGTVTDTSGAVVPQAQISIKNVATGVSTTVTSDAAGFYSAPNLLPGNYEVSASAPGFSTEVQSGVTLTVGAQQVLNFALRVGQVTQTVQVTGEAPTVDLASSAISAVVTSNTVVELPLNGRSWTDLATLQPGVVAITNQMPFDRGSQRGTRGYGDQISISGIRPQMNNYRLDGISMNDYANGAPGSVLGGNLGVDAIQEFSVLTSNYSAEYGKTSGGVVNAISRSGTNQFHGDAYEFLRNSAMDARNFFDTTLPPFRRNQFGASAGGPIWKDRTFIFGDYEGIRQSKGITNLSVVPSAAARAGNLCSAPATPAACTPATVVVDPAVQRELALFPLPNAGSNPKGNGDSGFFNFPAQEIVGENFFTTRIDHKFSEKDSIFGSYMLDRTNFTIPDPLDIKLRLSTTRRQIGALEWTHAFSSTLINSVRVGVNREYAALVQNTQALNPAAADTTLGAFPNTTAPTVAISGFFSNPGGLGSDSTQFYGFTSYQAYDDAFWTHGTHSLKFGFAFERDDSNLNSAPMPQGQFNFSTLRSFLTNIPFQTVFTSSLVSSHTSRGFRQSIFGAYIQDDWRWRPNLTVNLGLRYEPSTVITEVQGKLADVRNITDATAHLGSPYFNNPTLRNFAPRVGFAWDPFRNGKTSVRGGFGVFDSLPLISEFIKDTNQAAPFLIIGATRNLAPGSFPAGAAAQLNPNALFTNYNDFNPKRSYDMQWNLNVQRSISPTLTATVGYVGSRGIHLPYKVDDADQVIPTLTSAGYLYPNPVGSGTKLNPNFGAVKTIFYKADSFYDALELGLIKRISHGLQVQTSYTWGKSIDNNSATLGGDQFSNGISSLPWYDPSATRGLSDYSIGRLLVINATWLVPNAKSLTGPVAWFTNGWQLGAIYKASDGIPFTPTFGTNGDPLGIKSSDTWAFPDVLTGPGCSPLTNPGNPNNYLKTQCFSVPTAPSMAYWTANCDTTSRLFGSPATTAPFPLCFNLRGNAGRNILIGPGTSNLDFSLYKNNHIRKISENANIQFRAEVFNILNRTNFSTPVAPDNTDIFNAAGILNGAAGLLTSTSTTSREIQLALKLIW